MPLPQSVKVKLKNSEHILGLLFLVCHLSESIEVQRNLLGKFELTFHEFGFLGFCFQGAYGNCRVNILTINSYLNMFSLMTLVDDVKQ